MDTQEKIVRVRLALDHALEFVATYPDLPGAPTVRLDEAPPLGAGHGPNPAALLTTAVANCLAASLLFCTRKARIPIEAIQVGAEAHLVRNQAGRYRVTRMTVDIAPTLPAADLERLERCRGIFEDFCIVTESVRRGVDVSVSVHPVATAVREAS